MVAIKVCKASSPVFIGIITDTDATTILNSTMNLLSYSLPTFSAPISVKHFNATFRNSVVCKNYKMGGHLFRGGEEEEMLGVDEKQT